MWLSTKCLNPPVENHCRKGKKLSREGMRSLVLPFCLGFYYVVLSHLLAVSG